MSIPELLHKKKLEGREILFSADERFRISLAYKRNGLANKLMKHNDQVVRNVARWAPHLKVHMMSNRLEPV